jgi:hypothetical protein
MSQLPTINLGGSNLPPEILGQQQALNRQQQMAQMLMQQGQQMPQGQMVSGRYVAPSFFQNILPLAQMYVGKQLAEKTDKQVAEEYKKLDAEKRAESERLAKALRGQETVTEMAGPYGQGVGANGTNVPMPTATMPGQPDYRGAVETILQNRFGTGREMLPALMQQAYPEARKPVVVAPGGSLVDEKGKLIYQAPFKPEAGTGIDEDGGYNKKGDWITPNKIFIGKSEVSKDREIAFTADQVRQGLKQITPEDVKKAASVLGSVTGSGPINYLAQQFGNDAVAAQTKINASSVMQILNNLPPGAASDKDIENAKSTFPGYGSQKALNEWIKNTRERLDAKVNSLNQKYGSESWYGNTSLNALNAEDKAALDWANSNPNDPRSAQIKQRLGK